MSRAHVVPLRSSGKEYLKGTVIRVGIRRTTLGHYPGFTGTSAATRRCLWLMPEWLRPHRGGTRPSVWPPWAQTGNELPVLMARPNLWQLTARDAPGQRRTMGEHQRGLLDRRPRPSPCMWTARHNALSPCPARGTTVRVRFADNPSGRPTAPLRVNKPCPLERNERTTDPATQRSFRRPSGRGHGQFSSSSPGQTYREASRDPPARCTGHHIQGKQP